MTQGWPLSPWHMLGILSLCIFMSLMIFPCFIDNLIHFMCKSGSNPFDPKWPREYFRHNFWRGYYADVCASVTWPCHIICWRSSVFLWKLPFNPCDPLCGDILGQTFLSGWNWSRHGGDISLKSVARRRNEKETRPRGCSGRVKNKQTNNPTNKQTNTKQNKTNKQKNKTKQKKLSRKYAVSRMGVIVLTNVTEVTMITIYSYGRETLSYGHPPDTAPIYTPGWVEMSNRSKVSYSRVEVKSLVPITFGFWGRALYA